MCHSYIQGYRDSGPVPDCKIMMWTVLGIFTLLRRILYYGNTERPTTSPDNDMSTAWIEALDLDRGLKRLALLLLPRVGLGTHDSATPLASTILVLICVALFDSRNELTEVGLILGSDLSQGNGSGSLRANSLVTTSSRSRTESANLLVYQCSEACLALDDGVWHTHLPAQGREEDDQLDRIDVVRDQD